MHRLGSITVIVVVSAVAGALLTGGTWFLIAYAQHPAAIGDRGFFTVGPGFDGLLGANIGLVQGALLGVVIVALNVSPTTSALLGAALGVGTIAIMGTRLTTFSALTVAVLSIIISMVVGWGTARLGNRRMSA